MKNMDKTVFPEAFKRYIELLALRLRQLVGASEYDMQLLFEDRPGDRSSQFPVYASIDVCSTYLVFTLRVNKSTLERWQDGEFENVARFVCHEMCHVLTHPIAKLALSDAAPSQVAPFRDIVEQQTQRISNALTNAFPARFWQPAKLEEWVRTSGIETFHGDGRKASTADVLTKTPKKGDAGGTLRKRNARKEKKCPKP